MPTQQITWTALPNGVENGQLRLAVFVAPRLGDGTTLGEFPDFLDWPSVIAQTTFTVELGGTTQQAAPLPNLDAGRWQQLFLPTLPVTPFDFPESIGQTVLRSFPASRVLGFIRDQYAQIGEASPEAFPSIDPQAGGPNAPNLGALIDAVGPVGGVRGGTIVGESSATLLLEAVQELESQLEQARALRGGETVGTVDPVTVDFWRAMRFYHRPENHAPYAEPDASQVPEMPPPPELDFHRVLGALTDYPALMRRLGLVVELEVPVPPGLAASGWVRVVPQTPAAGEAVLPRTRYAFAPGSFLTAPSGGSDYADGQLRLDDASRFAPMQVDVDGSAHKLINFASNMHHRRVAMEVAPDYRANAGQAQAAVPISYATPRHESVPALQSTGPAVTKVDRAYAMAAYLPQTVARNAQIGTNADIDLYLDDVVRGYRVDVYDEAADRWYSLCERVGRFRIDEDPATDLVIEEEGYVKVSAATKAVDGSSDDLYLHEALFQWDGWSLAAERPGFQIVPETTVVDNRVRQTETVERVTPALPAAFALRAEFNAAPGSLPRLRFGGRYRLRARAVDLAGHSLPPTLDDGARATPTLPYRRYEPIAAPTLVLRAPVTEGESVERMVLRSDFDKTPAEYVQQEPGHGTYLDHCDRHVVPPKASQEMAERHGAFDAAIGNGKPGAAYQTWFNIAVKEAGTLRDTVIVDTTTGQPTIPVPGLRLVTPPPDLDSPPTVSAPPDLPKGDIPASGEYYIHTEADLLLPYLPDPFARRATFRGLPGLDDPDAVRHVGFEQVFPDAEPFRVRIVEGSAPPDWNAGQRELRVFLPKATIAHVRLSTSLPREDFLAVEDQLGIWQWLSDSARQDLIGRAIEGQHWMLTPGVTLTLVHAVQRPLQEPGFNDLGATKPAVGDTHALLAGAFDMNVASTGKLDLLAAWDEVRDFPRTDDPPPQDNRHAPAEVQTGRVLELTVHPHYDDGQPFPVPATSGVADAEQTQPGFYRHDFGDTKYREVRYRLVGTTRFREYFPPRIYEDPPQITRTGPDFTVKVLSSARPEPPKVLYVVPTFGWERGAVNDGQVSRRCGGGLRVYLDRPWYSSGAEELLGVVVRGGSFGLTTGIVTPTLGRGTPATSGQASTEDVVVTAWGVDPIWKAEGLPSKHPGLGAFPDAARTQSGLTLPEVDGETFAVAGHTVHFDAERGLWYSDVTVDTGDAYYPFIRLALCRYQPNSIADCHLSGVVVTDFIQTVPDRVAALTRPSDTEVRVLVSGVYGGENVWPGAASPAPQGPSFLNPQGNLPSTPNQWLIQTNRLMTATLEGRFGDSWRPIAPETTDALMEPQEEAGARIIWAKTFELPDPQGTVAQGPAETPTARRVAVREYEFLGADADNTFLFGGATVEGQFDARVVYADVIEIQG